MSDKPAYAHYQFVPRTAKYERAARLWPEPSPVQSALLLRAESEPYNVIPVTWAILAGGVFVGLFTYRSTHRNTAAFVGMVIAPEFRGKGYAVPAMRAAMRALGALGYFWAWGSVAAANKAALYMDFNAGFTLDAGNQDWRMLPEGFDLATLDAFKPDTYRLDPVPALLYHRVRCMLRSTTAG